MPDSDNRPPALLITRNLPPLVGGMERLVWHIADELRAAYALHVVAPTGCEAHLPSGVTASGVALRPLWRFLLSSTWASLRQALRLRPRLVFAGSGLTAPIAWLAARLAGGHCVVYLHGLDIETRHPLYRFLWHPFLRRFDRVIANSRFTRELAADIGIARERLTILHPGVHMPEMASADQQRQDFRERHRLADSPLMLYVGRITERKGLLPFVRDVLPGVIAAIPDARLVVIGDEPTQALLSDGGLRERIHAQLRDSGLEQHVLFLGELPVQHPDIDAAYFAADVLVFPVQDRPGDNEGFGMVAVEAAAHGLPTVAFAVGGVKDAVAEGKSGYLVEAGDNQRFTQRVNDILRVPSGHPEQLDIRRHAIEFAWPAFGERLRRLAAEAGSA